MDERIKLSTEIVSLHQLVVQDNNAALNIYTSTKDNKSNVHR